MRPSHITSNPPSMIKPSKETWSGRIALSELDQTGMTAHTSFSYFYSQSSQNWIIFLQTLTNSVSVTLVHFYPLAGRLVSTAGGRLELNCNAAGIQFTEAHADVKLADLDDHMKHPIFNQLIPTLDYGHTSLEEMPLLLLQVTRFQCGGWCLGILISHVVVDGQGVLHFLSEWARVCRGEPLGPPPYLDRKVLRAGDPPSPASTNCNVSIKPHYERNILPKVLGQGDNENERNKQTTVTVLKLTETFVKKLQHKANNYDNITSTRKFTRYEVITAHIWQTICMVRNLEPEQPTLVVFCLDSRSRMNPPLPDKYFGNAIIDVVATGSCNEIVKETLGYVSSKIRDTIEKVNDEFVNSVIDYLKNQKDLSKFQDLQLGYKSDDKGSFLGNPNVNVFTWLGLPKSGMDFGCGKEIIIRPGTSDARDGDFLLLPKKEGDTSLYLFLCLQVRHMEDFERVFYQSIEQDFSSYETEIRSKY